MKSDDVSDYIYKDESSVEGYTSKSLDQRKVEHRGGPESLTR